MRRILLAAVAASSLILAGCGGSDSGDGGLDAIKVSSAKSPKVTVSKGFTTSKTESKVLKSGGGAKLASGDAVKVNYVAVNGRTGKQFDSSFKSQKPLTLTLDKNAVLPGFVTGLEGKKIGSRVLVAISPKDGFGQDQAQLDIKKNDTMVFLFDIVAKVPTEVTGTAKKLPADVPKLVLDGDKHPTKFTKTSKTAKKITKESSHVVIQGDGAKITDGQTLTAQYIGQVYPDGAIFDESWSSSSRSFQVGAGQLIKCWDDQLVGQKLGSRVVLVCPGDKAYGDSPPDGSKIGKNDTLIFAIDLLDAS
ncbi:FKBP-type peptidyl-prolyl cis-trans isomerase [Aeromicrobium sp.]|uniref:FKBP-type peptidyl-prolyl cis-trans isomerase n=1 Tax=Aeromicrobium sp. TaxID=1871063 RepID=UPI003C5DE458